MNHRQEKLPGVHAMRGYAALLVVLCHAAQACMRFSDSNYLLWIMEGGFVGVCFFFVLSGFIMAYVHGADERNLSSGKTFAIKRITRVVPIYWIITILIFGVLIFAADLGEESHRTISGLLSSLFFLPTQDGPILRVGWTLAHEMLFYLIFAVSFYAIKKPTVMFLIWMACILVFGLQLYTENIRHPMELTQANLLLSILLSPLNLLFLMGLLATSPRAMRCCNWVTSVNGLRLILLAMGFGLAIVWYLHESFALFTQSSVPWIRPLLYGVISVGILALAADRRVGSWFDDRMHKLIGDASYSIYLTHYHAIAATGIVLKKVGLLSFFHPVVQFFIMAAVGICSGIVFHYLVEKPLTRWLSQKWKRRAVPTLAA